MMTLKRNEVPNTKAEFLKKWKNDYIFRCKAQNTGFNVVLDNVIFPDGQVAGARVK